MPPLRAADHALVSSPTPETVWRLRGRLLAAGLSPDCPLFETLSQFHAFLSELSRSSSAREYSHLASMLDIGGIGAAVSEHLLESEEAHELARRLLGAILSEGLLVLATRQHVKAWEEDMAGVYESAAWYLYGELWRWSQQLKPELAPVKRRILIEQALRPARSRKNSGAARAVILARIFQLLILDGLSRELDG